MPLYDYRCSACNNVTEVRHGFGETFSGPCPQCGGKLNRVFNPAPIVFKGSGFYVTDSRGKSKDSGTKESSSSEPAAKETPAKEPAKESKPKSATDPAA